METIANNIEFDLYKTLYLIKTNDDLFSVYEMGISDSLDETLFYIKNNSLSEGVYGYLHEIFTSIILVEEKYLSIYNSINHSYEAPKQIETSKPFVLPRRYGRNKILNDIKSENRKSTQIERTMFAINEIRNIYCNLERKLIHDLFVERNEIKEGYYLTDEEYRDIIATQELLSNKLKKILNRKKT
jgi:hypothetical protein